MPALLNPYCTVEVLKRELKFPQGDSGRDEDLKDSINKASRWVDNYTQRNYFQHDHSSTPVVLTSFDEVAFGNLLFIKKNGVRLRINTITEIKENGTVLTVGTHYAVRDSEIWRVGGDWVIGESSPNVIEVKGLFGYPQAAVTDVPTGLPEVISLATQLVAAALSGHNRKEVVGLDGQKQSILNNEIPKTVFAMLGRQNPVLV